MLGFILVAFHVVGLPQELRSMNLMVARWWTGIRPVLHVVPIILVGAIIVGTIVVGAIVVGVVFNVGSGLIGSSGGLRSRSVRLP